MNSILQKKKECYICKTIYNLECHHCIYGIANRKLSERDGLKVWLCVEHHRGSYGVHGNNGHDLDLKLKKKSQLAWQEYYNKTKEDFIKEYGRSYI